ncbi:MAG: peptidoglycan-binding domain-containing protein [Pseudomonadota bacterium]
MKKHTRLMTAPILMMSLAAGPAAADLKDLLIGGAIGAVVVDQLHRSNDRRQASQASVSGGTNTVVVAPSLNSQYTLEERILIQQSLNDLGYAAGTVDGVIGPNSRRAISSYQSANGHSSTGQLTGGQYAALTNEATGQAAITENRPLRSDEVVMLQEGLNKLGYFNGEINGVVGPGTNGALTAFLVNQQVEPQSVNPVQALVLVSNEAEMVVPTYLVEEAAHTPDEAA